MKKRHFIATFALFASAAAHAAPGIAESIERFGLGATIALLLFSVLGALAAFAFQCLLIYNRLVQLRSRISNAWAQIEVQLKHCHDLIFSLVEVAARYLTHEQEALQDVTAAREQAASLLEAARANPASAVVVGQLMAGESALMGCLGRLMAEAEAYPALKADKQMRELFEEITGTENRACLARQAYNDAVLDLNDAVRRFPAVLVVRMTGFEVAAPPCCSMAA